MDRQTILIILFAGVLAQTIFWKLTDPRSFKEAIAPYFQLRTYLLVGAILAVVLPALFFDATWSIPGFDNLVSLIGLVIFFSGLAFGFWAKITMSKVWGIPGQHEIKRQNKLVITGPFRYSRNPIYVGLILMCIGGMVALRSYYLPAVSFVIGYFYLAIFQEEKLLEKYFGREYSEYKKKTPRFLISNLTLNK